MAKQLLERICDLQLITGVGIVVAGFSQLTTITYYHEEQVMNYWYLTLNSFWAARIDYVESTDQNLRTWVYRFAIFISSVLGFSFQAVIAVRQKSPDWDNIHGPCYRWSDLTTTWVAWAWVAGGAVFCLALFLLLSPWKTPLLDWWYYCTKTLQYHAISNLIYYHRRLSPDTVDSRRGSSTYPATSTPNVYLYALLAFLESSCG